ncbi:MAG: 50S ribosomal protein L4 [Desulfovibrio sp.]|jgi:large subunit ribosomal protein L4|nr:50S ribosomal protein L4 [Desulfovibrio sp.]
MAQVTVFDQEKKQAGSVTLAPEVFEIPVRAEILNLVVRAMRASWRAGTHQTLTRSMMKGGGAKPWRQKGTGRARSGSGISPVWTGGAVVFGPQPRDYSFKVNKKVRRLALKMALSSRLAGENLMVVKDISLPEAKTKYFAGIKQALGLDKALVVVPNDAYSLMLAGRNIPGLMLLPPEQLNVYDVLKHPQLVLLEGVIDPVTARLLAPAEEIGAE